MKIADLDYYATYGESYLNKVSAKYKIFASIFVFLLALLLNNLFYLLGLYILLLICILFFRLPRRKVIKASLYPIIFTLIFLFSIENLSFLTVSKLILKVLCISTNLIILIFTTTYVKIFKVLCAFLPDIMLNILFNTYRSIFIINNTLENLLITMKFRGGFNILRPIHTIKTIGNLIGFFVIKSIETSEKMYEGIKLRGYSEKFLFLKD